MRLVMHSERAGVFLCIVILQYQRYAQLSFRWCGMRISIKPPLYPHIWLT